MVDVWDYINAKGQWRKSGNEAIGFCPACHTTNERTFSVNLSDGRWVCNRKNNCGQSGGFRALQELYGDLPTPKLLDLPKRSYQAPQHKAGALKDDSKAFLTGRGLNDLTIGAWRVGQERTYYRKADGEADGIVWPVYDAAGKLVNIKGRCLTVKDFTNKKGCAKWPVGLHLVDTAINGRRLIVTEGELDAMSGWQYGLKNVVSLPNGAGDQTWIDLAWAWLDNFDEIAFAIDADAAGQDALDRIVRRLGFKWRLFTVVYPDGHKDLNACLMAGVTADAIKDALAEAKEIMPETVHTADWYIDRAWSLMQNRVGLSGIASGFSQLDAITHGFRDGEVTIWTGQSGSGKSTIIGQTLLNATTAAQRVCVSSLEIEPAKYLNWMVLQATGEANPQRWQHKAASRWMGKSIVFVDRVGYTRLEDLLTDWAYCARRFGCRIFVADPLQNLIADSDDNKSDKKVITSLVGFANEYRCHVHLVAHPKKQESDSSELGQNAIKGSKSITDLAHNILTVSRGDTTTAIKVIKNREYGVLGTAMVMVDRDCKQVFEASAGIPDFWPFINTADDDIPEFDSPPEMWAPDPGHGYKPDDKRLMKDGRHPSDV